MIFELYAIKDELSEFAAPMPLQTEDQAKRYFEHQVRESDIMNNNPEDFSIWNLGSYNTETGKIEPKEPKLVVRAKSIKKEKENE